MLKGLSGPGTCENLGEEEALDKSTDKNLCETLKSKENGTQVRKRIYRTHSQKKWGCKEVGVESRHWWILIRSQHFISKQIRRRGNVRKSSGI